MRGAGGEPRRGDSHSGTGADPTRNRNERKTHIDRFPDQWGSKAKSTTGGENASKNGLEGKGLGGPQGFRAAGNGEEKKKGLYGKVFDRARKRPSLRTQAKKRIGGQAKGDHETLKKRKPIGPSREEGGNRKMTISHSTASVAKGRKGFQRTPRKTILKVNLGENGDHRWQAS